MEQQADKEDVQWRCKIESNEEYAECVASKKGRKPRASNSKNERQERNDRHEYPNQQEKNMNRDKFMG